MYKKILALLLVTIMTVSLAACGASNADTKQDSNVVNSETITTNEDGDDAKVSAEGKVNKEKIHKLERADNDAIRIELWYRDGSDYVARITGEIVIPTGSTEYDGMLEENIAFDEKVKAMNLPEDIMQFSYGEVKLDNGYVRCQFSFGELDADNADSVAMIAEFWGLPTSNGYFKLSECEQYLLESGISLDYAN